MNTFAYPVLAVLIAAGAAVHGAATHRWAALAPAPELVEKLHSHSVQFADYQSEVIPSEIEIKEKSTVTCRRYDSPSLNVGAMISITSGPPGAVATHTPDVCYPSSGYKTLSPVKKATMALPGGATATYYVADFEKKTQSRTDRQRVRWSWAIAGGSWNAPDRPRFAYLREPELFKLYIVTPIPKASGDQPAEDPPAVTAFVTAAFAQYTDVVAGR